MLRLSTIILAVGTCAVVAACVTENNYPRRAAEVACGKLEQCAPDQYDASCEETYEALLEAAVGECDKYRGGLAHRCLAAIEEQSCDATDVPDPCEKFNDKCGFDEPVLLEGTDLESPGYGQLRAIE